MTGAAAVGTTGDFWNQVTNANTTNQALSDVLNATSGATLTVINASGLGGYGGYVNSPSNIIPLFSNILYDTNNSTPITLTFNGVSAGVYDLYVYSGGDGTSNRVSTATIVGGASATVGPDNPPPAKTLASPANYVELPVTVTGSGSFQMTFISTSEADLDGLQLVNVGSPLTWTGAGGSGGNANWDFTTTNWKVTGSSTPAVYSEPSLVTFDDGEANTNITVLSAQSNGVNPSTVTFTANSTPYTFTNGAGNSNGISGPGSVTLNGTGAVTFNSANTYTGPTTINAGTLRINNSNSLQNSTTTVNVNGGLLFGAGIGTANLGAIAGTGNVALSDTTTPTPAAVSLVAGSNGASTMYSGVLSGFGSLTKSGSGVLTLTNFNTYGGNTSITGGTLKLALQLSPSASISAPMRRAVQIFWLPAHLPVSPLLR